MNNFEIINKLKKDFRYCLEYDYFLQSSSDVEFLDVNGIICLLNSSERYCMVTDFCRDKLNDIEDIIRKKIGGNKILLNFNVDKNIDIEYLKKNKYKFNSVYDSYVYFIDNNHNFDFANNSHIIELTSQNINCYTYNDCNEKIQYRPSFEKLVDVFLHKNNGRIIAYIKNNCILGYLSYINIFENVNDVDYIYVTDKYRNIGIGTMLGKYYAKISKNESKTAIWSNATETSSKVAIKSGFEWCCKHMSFYKEIDN